LPKFNTSDTSLIYIAINVFCSAMTFVWGMMLVRLLTKAEYGTFQQIILVTMTVRSFIALGLPQSLFYFIPKLNTNSEKKGIILQTLIILVGFGLLASGGFQILHETIASSLNNPLLYQYSFIIATMICCFIPSVISEAMFISIDKTLFAAFLNLSVTLLYILSTSIPLFFGMQLNVALKYLSIIYVLHFLFITIYALQLKGNFKSVINYNRFVEQVTYCLPLGLSTFSGIIKTHLDKFIIASCYSTEKFAIYSRGAFELPFVAIIPYALSNLMMPKISLYHKERKVDIICNIWNMCLRRVALLFFPLFLFCFIFADQIITLFFTMSYAESVIIFRIYLCLLPFRLAAYRTILQSIGNTKPVFYSTLITLFANISLNLIFFKLLGFLTPAVATVISEIIGMAYMLYATKKSLNIYFMDLIPFKKLSQIFSINIIFILPMLYLANLDIPKLLLLVIASLLFFPAYVIFMKLSRFLPEEDWKLILRWLSLQPILKKDNI